jgi:hypothetical protein
MKKISKLFLASALLSSTGLFAQNLNQSIYFESGKHELTEASKQALDQLVLEVKNFNDFDLDIKAFTDDIGTQKFNQALAERRAAAVQAYLENCKLEASSTAVEKVGEIALRTRENINEQRRQNRRVDINISPFQPQSIDDVFSYFSRRNRQEFTIRLGSDTTLIAKDGTQLFVPAGSFELAENGEEVKDEEVVISLQEAIDYQNMLMHNLTTMSDGEMIETGGMVYFDAKTKDGQQLQVREGAELTLSIPSEKQLPKDMQLFYADRTLEDNAAPINWQATGQNFQSTNFDQEEPVFSFKTIKFPMIPNIEEPLVEEWPAYKEAPKAPVAPRKSKLRPTDLLTVEDLKAEHPQKRRESNQKYEARIEDLFVKAKREQEINIRYNENAEKRYAVEFEAYQKDMLVYRNEMLAHDQMLKNKELLRHDLYNKYDEIQKWFNTFRWSEDYQTTLVRFMRSSRNFERYRDYLIFECERLGFTEELEELKAMDFEMHRDLKKIGVAFARCLRANFDFNKNHKIADIRVKVGELIGGNYLPDMDAARIADDMIYGVYTHATLLNKLIDNYNEVLTKSGFRDKTIGLDEVSERMAEIRLKVVSEKVKLGLASPKEIESVYMNTVGINRIGWINCDRFRNIPNEERVIVSVDMPAEPNVKLYAVFTTVQGVMPLHPRKGTNKYIAAGVPKNEGVKIFGLKVVDGKMQTAEYEGNAEDLKDVKLIFKDTKLKELRNMFS